MATLKIGIIGIGNMGSTYVHQFNSGQVKGATLTAVCDLRQERLDWVKETMTSEIDYYRDAETFLQEADLDGVMIATPHYDHPTLAIKAFERGLHVLVEKPAGVATKTVSEMNDAAAESGKVFGIMYNQRTNPLYQKLRQLIQDGELGEIKRTNWVITDWYRSQSYYDSGGWRATWAGEGGGALINQCPHQLDLWQWTTGLMPVKVHGFCGFGKYHDIEVEDDVTAYVEYENGATGVFITSTGEAPGTNRFEVVGDRGKTVIENGKLTFHRLTESEREFNKHSTTGFATPECWKIDIPVYGRSTDHLGILQNWVKAIREGTPLLAPGEEGIKGLEISNAIHLSSWLEKPVSLPIDQNQYETELQKRINTSTYKKENTTTKTLDLTGSH